MILFFTGTGNSRYCAQMLADKLDDEVLDAFPFLRDGAAPDLFSDRPWVFVAPTYGWQLPRVFAQLIRSGRFRGSRDAYFVMTCGGDIGNAAAKNRKLCTEAGLCDRGTLEVVMPENYIAMYDVPGEAEARDLVAAARPVIERGAACIREGLEFPAQRAGAADRLKSGMVNSLFYRFCVRARAFAASGGCIGCGKCERVCPLGNIHLEGGKPVWGGRCTHCMACICSCPVEAIEYGKASRGKPRYQCPEYKTGE